MHGVFHTIHDIKKHCVVFQNYNCNTHYTEIILVRWEIKTFQSYASHALITR